MNDSMVLRVAKTIAYAQRTPFANIAVDRDAYWQLALSDSERDAFEGTARVAIGEMHEPTKAMLESAYPRIPSDLDPADVWQAMIKTALV